MKKITALLGSIDVNQRCLMSVSTLFKATLKSKEKDKEQDFGGKDYEKRNLLY